MKSKAFVLLFALSLAFNVFPQTKPQTASQNAGESEPTIRISTELIQLDAVVTDKDGKVVKGLNKDDFEVFENGKRQEISFFEFVDAENGSHPGEAGRPSAAERQTAVQGAGAADVKRIFAFVIDDLTMQPSDLIFVRDMLKNFVENRMQPTDLVAIVRVVGGNSLLQQFTTDKDILRRAILKLNPSPNPLNAYNQYEDPTQTTSTSAPSAAGGPGAGGISMGGAAMNMFGGAEDQNSETDEANSTLRSFMTLGTAEFVIEGMKELPGRKAMILVSGGLPALGGTVGSVVGDANYFLQQLGDRATRAGVAINTLDIRGLSAQTGVASFDSTPGKSAIGGGGSSSGFGRLPDPALDGTKIPFDVIDAHMGLRELSNMTGGIAELNRNDFNKALDKIVETNQAYYLLAYTPADQKFNGEYRKLDIKVKGAGYKVLTRRGYLAHPDPPPAPPKDKQEELLRAIKSPLAKRDINLDASLFYAAEADNKGRVGIGLAIDPSKLKFETVGDKQVANLDVATFVYDELGKMRGGVSQTISASLTPAELEQFKTVGIPYGTNTTLPPGVYQIRLAVRDNATNSIGTISRYIEVPDLSRGHFSASSLVLGAVAAGDTKAGMPDMLPNLAFSRKQDLRYGIVVYNPKVKDGAAAVTADITISRDGKPLYHVAAQPMTPVGGKATELIKIGQVGLGRVAKGRYRLTIIATDTLADKKTPPKVRTLDFTVVD
ncbi:MAG TPA: VWA domain-containing protein [Blastocatellia bacterium]